MIECQNGGGVNSFSFNTSFFLLKRLSLKRAIKSGFHKTPRGVGGHCFMKLVYKKSNDGFPKIHI